MTRRRGSSPVVHYLSHHKCATMYADSILGRTCAELGLKKETLFSPEDFGDDLADFTRRHRSDLICYLDAEWDYVRDLGDILGVHVIRDPRDILVSAYFSHLHSHQTESWPELREHRERLEKVPKDEGLYLEMDFSGYVFDSMGRWDYDRDGVLELTFEELAEEPYQFWLRVARHLELIDEREFGLRRNFSYLVRGVANQAYSSYSWWPLRFPLPEIPAQRLLGIVHDNRFEQKTGGREPGQDDPTSHYRKGQPGDWKNHLTEGHLQEFERRYPDLLEKTGYAQATQPSGGQPS